MEGQLEVGWDGNVNQIQECVLRSEGGAKDKQLPELRYADDVIGAAERVTGVGINLGRAYHVLATTRKGPCPGFFWKALRDKRHPDYGVWHASHKEECDNMRGMTTYAIISDEEVKHLKVKPIPTMNILTVKIDEQGRPVRAKSRTVVLGNEETHWSKQDVFAPVLNKASA